MKKQLLGVNITIDTKEDILLGITTYLQGKSTSSPLIIVTPNPEQVVLAQTDEEFLKILNRADIALPDGVGIVWAMKALKSVSIKRISGIDCMMDLVRLANKNRWTIGLVGGQNTVGKKTLDVLQSSYQNLKGWAIEPEQTDEKKLAKHITDSNTRIVFVGLGAPKQEEYIDAVKKQCKGVVFMAVGGSFDVIAGVVPRAPLWMQTIGLEWLYRLGKQPWRWRRQLALIRFFMIIIQSILTRLINV